MIEFLTPFSRAQFLLKSKFFLLLYVIFPASHAFSQLELKIVHPPEGQVIISSDSTFVYGSVNYPQAQVFVNNQPATVYPNGAFLAFVPIEAGNFTFECVAKAERDTARVFREVIVPGNLMSVRLDTFAIDTGFMIPQNDIELIAGDYLNVAFKGTPGMNARFMVPGLVENSPMAERSHFGQDSVRTGFGNGRHWSEGTGIYTGIYQIPPGMELENAEIEFRLRGTDGLDVRKKAPGKVTVRNEMIPRLAVIIKEEGILKSSSAGSNQLYVPRGAKLHITGKQADLYRAHLTNTEDVWIPENDLEFLPAGTHIPSGKISFIQSQKSAKGAIIKIHLDERLPFKIAPSSNPAVLTVSLYGATNHTGSIRYDLEDEIVREIVQVQPSNSLCQLRILLNEKLLWGFNPYYEGTNLILEINQSPKDFSLKNMVVCLDPGHAPDIGAIGATGVAEKDANLQLALLLQKKLADKGASVFLTRRAYHGASTQARKKIAVLMGADVLISIHHDRPSDASNPFLNRGSRTHYFLSQSYNLAQAIQTRLLEKLKLQDFGLNNDNRDICQLPQMPSVLIQPASIVHPDEERLIATEKFREKVADAVVKGVEDFLKYAKE